MMNLPDPREIHNSYQTALPYPHIVLKNIFDEPTLRAASEEFEKVDNWKSYSHEHVCNKFSMSEPLFLQPACKSIVNDLNSATFVKFLAKLTGYRKIISDPSLKGGGLHKTTSGGFLDIHRDFNYSKQMKANRRLNALLFLNPNWAQSWHGELELWDENRIGKRVSPIFGDVAIFSTTDAYHGHPYALKFPDGEDRKSIATYYYQIGKPTVDPHGTIYKTTQ